MVSSKVSFRTSMFPVSVVRNRIKNLGNISLNAALGTVFNGFLHWKQFPARKHGSFLDVSSHCTRCGKGVL